MSINSKYFVLQEYLPKAIYLNQAISLRAKVGLIDQRLIDSDDFIREWFDVPIVINNWHLKNQVHIYNESGFRTRFTETGGDLSQHRHGRASDKKFKGLTPKFVFNEILKYEKVFFDAGVRRIENVEFTKTWIHTDVAQTNIIDKILVVDP